MNHKQLPTNPQKPHYSPFLQQVQGLYISFFFQVLLNIDNLSLLTDQNPTLEFQDPPFAKFSNNGFKIIFFQNPKTAVFCQELSSSFGVYKIEGGKCPYKIEDPKEFCYIGITLFNHYAFMHTAHNINSLFNAYRYKIYLHRRCRSTNY